MGTLGLQVKDRERRKGKHRRAFCYTRIPQSRFTPDNNLKESINKPFSAFETVVLTDTQAGL